MKQDSGFTLIEMLVVISTLSVLTGMLVVYHQISEKQIKLITEQAKLVGIILRAKSLTLQAFKETDPPCSFGVHFDSPNRKYLIFRETNRDAQNRCINDKRYGSDEELAGQNFVLDAGLIFTAAPVSDIVFVPPDPKIYFDGLIADRDLVFTIAAVDNTDLKASVIVNRVGQITVP
jgi:prepilin-type N-terminal cleavage/methylation domain-containing protein